MSGFVSVSNGLCWALRALRRPSAQMHWTAFGWNSTEDSSSGGTPRPRQPAPLQTHREMLWAAAPMPGEFRAAAARPAARPSVPPGPASPLAMESFWWHVGPFLGLSPELLLVAQYSGRWSPTRSQRRPGQGPDFPGGPTCRSRRTVLPAPWPGRALAGLGSDCP